MGAPSGTVWINGEFFSTDEAKMSIFDGGFVGGTAVFDTLACWKGKIFKLQQHIERFQRSAHAAAIPLPLKGTGLAEVIVETTRRAGHRDAYVQVIVTPGMRYRTPDTPPASTLIVFSIPYIWIGGGGEAKVDTGLNVIIPSIRNTPVSTLDPKIKNFNRFHQHLAGVEASGAGADDVVLLDQQGYLTESRGANVFLIHGGEVFTPALGVLQGITRQTVFEIAAEFGLPLHERDLTPYDLYSADEAFLSSTAGGILPLVRADSRQIGSGIPGPLTRRIHDRYWERHLSGPDTTPVFD
jgi:branched-chain amino acid aminotransferase